VLYSFSFRIKVSLVVVALNISFLTLLSCGKKKSTEPQPGGSTIDFNAEILPILQTRCNTSGCHGGQAVGDSGSGLVFSSFESMRQTVGQKTNWAKPLIIPGNPDSSHLVLTIRQTRLPVMPPTPLPALSQTEINKISDWIKQGARGVGGKKFPTYREGKLYVANSSDGRVDVVDLSMNYRTDSILTAPVGTPATVVQTHHIVASPDKNYIYVTNAWGQGDVVKIDTQTDTVVARVRAGYQPADIVITPDGQYLHLSNYNQNSAIFPNPNSTIRKINAQTMSPTDVDTFIVGRAPHGIGISSDGKMVVTPGEESDDLWLVYPDSGQKATVRLPLRPGASFNNLVYKPFAVVLSSNDSLAYVSCTKNNQIRMIDVKSGVVVDSILLGQTSGNAPLMLALDPNGNKLYVSCLGAGTLAIIDLTSKDTSFVRVGQKAHAPAVVSDSLVYVTCEGNHVTPYKVYVVNTISKTVVDSIDVGRYPNGIAVLRP
jgi:YVTN family beta-propeller protein